MKKSTSNAIFGFIAGAAAGALAGILLAPDKGTKTRKKISKKVKDTSDQVTSTLGEKVDYVKDKIKDFVK